MANLSMQDLINTDPTEDEELNAAGTPSSTAFTMQSLLEEDPSPSSLEPTQPLAQSMGDFLTEDPVEPPAAIVPPTQLAQDMKGLQERTESFEDFLPFGERQAVRLGRGQAGKEADALQDELETLGTELTTFEKGEPVMTPHKITDRFGRVTWVQRPKVLDNTNRIKELTKALDLKATELSVLRDAEQNPLVERNGKLVVVPPHPVMVDLQKAQADGDMVKRNKILWEHADTIMAEAGLSSVTRAGWSQVLAAPGAAIATKFVTGLTSAARVAFAATAGADAGSVEYNASIGNFLDREGVDYQNTDTIKKAFRDPELLKRAKAYAKERALPIGAIGALSSYIAAHRVVPPGLENKIAQNVANGSFQFVQGSASEGLGEFAAQKNAGEKIDSTAIIMEVMAGFPSAIAEPVIFTLADKLGANKGAKNPRPLNKLSEVLEVWAENPDSVSDADLVAGFQELSASAISEPEVRARLIEAGFLNEDADTVLADKHQFGAYDASGDGVSQRELVLGTQYEDSTGQVNLGQDLVDSAQGGVHWRSAQDLNVDTIESNIRGLAGDLERSRQTLDFVKQQGESSSVINSRESDLTAAYLTYQNAINAQNQMVKLRPKLQGLLTEMFNTYLPGHTVLVQEDNLVFDTQDSGNQGSLGTISTTGEASSVLHLNVSAIMETLNKASKVEAANRNSPADTIARFSQSSVLSTMTHEFGHALFTQLVGKLPPGVTSALHAEHREFIAKALKDGSQKARVSKSNPARTSVPELAENNTLYSDAIPTGKDGVNLLSFNEFVADMVSRQVNSDKSAVGQATKRHLPRIRKVLAHMFNRFSPLMKKDDTFSSFLNYIQQRSKVQVSEALLSKHGNVELSASTASLHADLKKYGIDAELNEIVQESLDSYNGFTGSVRTLLQLAKDNPHVQGLQTYVEAVHQQHVTKSNWNHKAMESLNAWQSLGYKTAGELGRFMLELTLESDSLGRKLTPQEIETLLKTKGIDFGRQSEEAYAMFKRLESDLESSIQTMQVLEQERLQKAYVNQPEVLQAKLAESENNFLALSRRNYFPLSRFGRFVLNIRAREDVVLDGKTHLKGKVIHSEFFESKRERTKGEGTLRRQYKGDKFAMESDVISEEAANFAGYPEAILKSLKEDPKMNLTEEQKAELQDVIDGMSSANNIAKRMLKRKGTRGFSRDAQRGYAAYMQQMGIHVARLTHSDTMELGLAQVKDSAETLSKSGIRNDKRVAILDHLQRHKAYLRDPGNELAGLRAFGFHWYLGFVPKSALINLTQIPMVAYPYLASRKELTNKGLGIDDARVMFELGKAMKDMRKLYADGGLTDVGENDMLAVLVDEGIIDESLASELAGQAHGEFLDSMLAGETYVGDRAKRALSGLTKGSTFMFQAAEKLNRRIVALAAYRLAKANGMEQSAAVSEAREALRSSQFEYAQWNRPEVMRGLKSPVFLFMQYLQNTLYFVARDPGKARYLMVLLLAAGLQGLPGAEDMLDMLDFGKTLWKKHTGWEDPHTDSRIALRQWVQELGGDPDLIMHGLASQSMGLSVPAVGAMTGMDVVPFDVTGSLSAGRIIPGMQGATATTSASAEGVVNTASDVIGAAFSIPLNVVRTMTDDDPNTWRKMERVMPVAMKNLSQAARFASEGSVRTRGGEQVLEFDMNNPRHVIELSGKALGFNPTRLAQARELAYAKREASMFYAESRATLAAAYAIAIEVGVAKDVREADANISRFNKTVPIGQQLTTQGQSAVTRALRLQRSKSNVPERVLDVPLHQDIQTAFPDATDEKI